MSTEEKPKKAWYKRWWAITLWVILILGIIGAFMDDSGTNSTIKETQQEGDTPLETDQPIITKSIDVLFPTREQIPTEFKTNDIENITMHDDIPFGFESGKSLSTTKLINAMSGAIIVVGYDVIKFNSTESAENYHIEKINTIKSEGGYTETDVKVSKGTNCFSTITDYGFQAKFAISNCQKKNIIYQVIVTASNTYEKPQKYLQEMVPLIDERIN